MGREPRFQDLTETTGVPVSPEGASMMYTRYALGRELAQGRRVLELGCGAGHGFGLLGEVAQSLVGGDYSAALIRQGRAHYLGRYPFVRLSADSLPFRDACLDVILCFEASYYVPDMRAAFREISRLLGATGTALFVNANPERADFIRSPHSVHYHSADEFRLALESEGFVVTVEGAFPVSPPATSKSARLGSLLLRTTRRVLEALRLVPRTLRGRARLKRLLYGKLTEVPAELPRGFAAIAPRAPLTAGPVRAWKVLYVRADRLA